MQTTNASPIEAASPANPTFNALLLELIELARDGIGAIEHIAVEGIAAYERVASCAALEERDRPSELKVLGELLKDTLPFVMRALGARAPGPFDLGAAALDDVECHAAHG